MIATLPKTFLMNESIGCGSVTLGAAIEELISAKQNANRRPSYVRQLRSFLTLFARGRETMPLAMVNRMTIEEWFRGRNQTPVTRRSRTTFLSALFSFACRVGYLQSNPCAQLERISVDRSPPRILSPAEVRRMLNYARRHMWWRLPQLVLGVYAGIRPHELTRIYRKDIDLERGYVRVDAAAAKTRQRRIVNLDPKCIAWLKRCRFREHRPIGSNSDHWKRLLARHCGIEWTADVLRHSAASYLLAKYGDAGKVARMLGNSPAILLTHYTELVAPQDARRFWKV